MGQNKRINTTHWDLFWNSRLWMNTVFKGKTIQWCAYNTTVVWNVPLFQIEGFFCTINGPKIMVLSHITCIHVLSVSQPWPHLLAFVEFWINAVLPLSCLYSCYDLIHVHAHFCTKLCNYVYPNFKNIGPFFQGLGQDVPTLCITGIWNEH